MRDKLQRVGAVLLTLLVWQLGAWALGQRLLLPGPVTVARRLAELVGEGGFLSSVGFTLGRIALGFLAGALLAAALGALAARYRAAEILLRPVMTAVKSVPVASFVILVLIWLGSERLSVFIAFLMVLPVVYTGVLQGLKSADVQLLEMARVFHLGPGNRLRLVLLPALKPYLLSSCGVAAGLAWKAGVAAEVIGIPDGSIGERLYEAKVYLSSPDLFAWTVVVVALSAVFEKLFLALMKLGYRRLERS